ncbi:hypothetical protein Taro_037975 [Colocasia esculenta]|uniref:Uncharacterized protein n=1 Tax=Colocasia esculenta TaxID=4460 RepID=A0A843WKU4_COLES|nr:hypothetical protein [Colocasia esculenta]
MKDRSLSSLTHSNILWIVELTLFFFLSSFPSSWKQPRSPLFLFLLFSFPLLLFFPFSLHLFFLSAGCLERTRENPANPPSPLTSWPLFFSFLLPKEVLLRGRMERENLGDDYTTLGAYLKAHQTKNGDYPDEYTHDMCEKVIETCAERDITNSPDPCILYPILDAVYKGHHWGYERGRGLGWSRVVPWSKLEVVASNESLQHVTLELQNARAEIEAMQMREKEMEARQMEELEAMKGRERDMQESNKEMKARLERMEALLSMHFSNGSVLLQI